MTRARGLALGLAACGPVRLGGREAAEGPWREVAALPEPRQECAVVVHEGRVVAIGGYDDGPRMLASVVAWDPAADRWERLPDLPRPLHHPNGAVLEGVVHVAGGLGEGFVVVGGLLDTVPVASHFVFDGAWTRLPDAPTARDHAAAIGFDGGFAVVAGRAGGLSSFVAATEVWDGAGWRVGAPIPTPRGGALAGAGEDGLLHVLGGEGSDEDLGVFEVHEVYDPLADAWTVAEPMETPRHGSGAAVLDGLLVAPGGAPEAGFGAVDRVEVLE